MTLKIEILDFFNFGSKTQIFEKFSNVPITKLQNLLLTPKSCLSTPYYLFEVQTRVHLESIFRVKIGIFDFFAVFSSWIWPTKYGKNVQFWPNIFFHLFAVDFFWLKFLKNLNIVSGSIFCVKSFLHTLTRF